MTVGGRLKSLRHGMDMTLKEMSAELGVSLNTVYRWEHDLVTPRKGTLNKLADVYQVPLKWLMFGATVEEGPVANTPVVLSESPLAEDKFEQNLLRLCRNLSETSKYKILGYAERIWVEDMREDGTNAAALF